MFSVRSLVALVAVVGGGFQAMAGDCHPPNPCFLSLSKDPIGAEPYCSSILTTWTTTVTATVPGSGGSTSTLLKTHTVTETVTTRTETLPGATDLETSTSSASVTEQIDSTLTSEATETTVIVQTSPVTQTSVAIDTVETTVYVYRTSTTVVITSTTEITTEVVGEYDATQTEYLTTATEVVVTLVPRGDYDPVPTPSYLSTCPDKVVTRACRKLYPPSPVTETCTITGTSVASDIYVTETVTVTENDHVEHTVTGAKTTKTVIIGGTRTIYTTAVETKVITQVKSVTSVESPTEVVVVDSTITDVETETTYSPTVTDYSTEYITSVFTDNLDGKTKTITLSTRTVTKVETSHTAIPTYLRNAGFDDDPPTTEPWSEYNAGTRAPITLNGVSQAGPFSLQIGFSRLTENFHYSGYTFQALPKAAIVADKLYTVSAYLMVSASARPRSDGCSVAYLYCAFGRDKYTQAYQYSRYDDTSVMVGQWWKAERTCYFTAAQLANPYDVGIVIGFTCGAAQAYVDTVSFAPTE